MRVIENVTIHEEHGGIKYPTCPTRILNFGFVNGSINGTSSEVGSVGAIFWVNGLPYFNSYMDSRNPKFQSISK